MIPEKETYVDGNKIECHRNESINDDFIIEVDENPTLDLTSELENTKEIRRKENE